MHAQSLQSCPTLWTAAHQAPLSIGFSRQEYWIGLPCPPPGDLPDPGIKPESSASPALQVDSLPLGHGEKPNRVLLVCKDWMGGRAYFSKEKNWKKKTIIWLKDCEDWAEELSYLRGEGNKKEPIKELKRHRGAGGKPGIVASLIIKGENVSRSRKWSTMGLSDRKW